MDSLRPHITYSRYSPTGRATCESILTQQERMRDYCRALGRNIIEEYGDEELTGAEMEERIGLQNAIKHVSQLKGVLLVYKLDRLARNALDALEIANRLKKSGVAIASLMDGFDTSTDTGELFYKLLAVFAEWERKQIAARTSDAMRRHQSNGRRMTREDHVPYGWRPKNKKEMEPDEKEQAVIAEIRRLRRLGFTVYKIARRLDEQGMYRRNGGRWHPSCRGTIQKIMEREGIK